VGLVDQLIAYEEGQITEDQEIEFLALGGNGDVLATGGALPACGCDSPRGWADKATRASRS
jgi:hypothetical protein